MDPVVHLAGQEAPSDPPRALRAKRMRLMRRGASFAGIVAVVAGCVWLYQWHSSGGYAAWAASRSSDIELQVRASGGVADAPVLRELARRQMARRDWKGAANALSMLLETRDAGPADEASLARSLNELGQVDAAYTRLETARTRWPSDPDIALARADFFASRDSLRQELLALTEASKLRPKDMALTRRLARLAFKQEQFDQAFAAYDTIRTKGEPDDEVYRRLGVIYLQRGKPKEAARYGEAALDMNPKQARNFLLVATASAQLTEESRESMIMAALERAMSLEPHMAASWVQYGIVMQKMGIMPTAVKYFQRGVDLDPYEEQPMLMLIGALERLGRRKEAQQVRTKQAALKKAKTEVFRVSEQLRRKQGDPDLQRKLGWLYVQTGRWRDARQYFAYLQAKNPSDTDAKKGVDLCNKKLAEESHYDESSTEKGEQGEHHEGDGHAH